MIERPDGIACDANFSKCRTWRYSLFRFWDKSEPHVLFVLLNPSTADEREDDPTLRRGIAYARKWNYGGVGFSIEGSLERMIEWLSDSFDVNVNAIVLTYIRTAGGEELITKTAIISEEVEQQRIKKKKFQIPMSDEPGDYDKDQLKVLLKRYLSQNLLSAGRIREVLLPAGLQHGRLSRDELKQEFVNYDKSIDASKVGYFLSLISGQVGMQKNDFLRQVIGYDYPNYSWEKDNYCIKDGYKDLVREVLEELREGVGSQTASLVSR